MFALIILLLAALAVCIYYVFVSHYQYWKKRGVPNPPVSYFFGNVGQSLTLTKSLGQIYDEIYSKYPALRYVGFYRFRHPGIIIRDPEIVKEVLLKSFNSFHANDIHVNEDIDPIIIRNPFFVSGERWKTQRSQLTPCFTSKQIKSMIPLMEIVSNNLVKHLEEINPISINAKDLSAKYTTDVVASCAFGLEANSFNDPDAEFKKMGALILSQSFVTAIKLLVQFAIPSLAKVLKTKFIPDEAGEYFKGIISETLKYREANNIVRGDFLDIMLEYKRKLGEHVFTDEDVTSHAISFIIDGFETSSIVLSFALYELAANLDVQHKLREEVNSVLAKYDGILNYEAVQEMNYLENIFCESNRMHPPGTFLGKLCTQSFTLPSAEKNGSEVTIEPNTSIVIPIYSLQNDPKYFPEPDHFDPERFSEENKEHIKKCTYLPFGDGPRQCLGQRFGTTQVKVALAKLVSKFDITVNSKTKTPLEIDPTYFLLAAKGGLWLDFHKRK